MVAQVFLCHRFSCVTKADVLEARSLIVDLNVYWYQYFIYFFINFCIRETPKRVLSYTNSQDEMQHNKLHFIRLYTA